MNSNLKQEVIKLAIFDIDGTIFRSSLLIEIINGFVQGGIFPQQAKKDAEREYEAWQNRKGTYQDYINKVIQIHVKYIGGVKEKDADRVARQIINIHKDRVYRFTRDLISRLKQEHYYLLAISGSPTYIVSKFAKVAGFQHFFGTEYEVKKGIYTGKVTNLDSARDKEKVLMEFLRKKNIKADLKKSFAVGDTESDIQVLELVGRPVAFNPNRELGDHARKKGWQVIVERKDIIYSLKDFSFINL